VVVLGVIGRVGQNAVKPHMGGSLTERLGKLGRIVAGASRDHDAGQKVRGRVTDHRELRPLPAPKRPIAVTVYVVEAGVAGLQPRGVNGPFGAFADQPELSCALEASPDKRLESPFFSSRSCA
jgi:hypothetical protein